METWSVLIWGLTSAQLNSAQQKMQTKSSKKAPSSLANTSQQLGNGNQTSRPQELRFPQRQPGLDCLNYQQNTITMIYYSRQERWEGLYCILIQTRSWEQEVQEDLDSETPSPLTFSSFALNSWVHKLTLCVKTRDGIKSRLLRMVQVSPMYSLQMISCFLQKLIPRTMKPLLRHT